MMDYKEKIQILRACSSKKGNRCSSCPAFGQGDRNCSRNAMKDAATAISTLQAENEKLRAENNMLRRMQPVELNGESARSLSLALETSQLWAELEQVKRDRDAARSDIETALAYGMKDCELCKNSQCYVRGGTKPCLPKWRGQKED